MNIGARTAAWAKSGIVNYFDVPTSYKKMSGLSSPTIARSVSYDVFYSSFAANGYLYGNNVTSFNSDGKTVKFTVGTNTVYGLAKFFKLPSGSYELSCSTAGSGDGFVIAKFSIQGDGNVIFSNSIEASTRKLIKFKSDGVSAYAVIMRASSLNTEATFYDIMLKKTA